MHDDLSLGGKGRGWGGGEREEDGEEEKRKRMGRRRKGRGWGGEREEDGEEEKGKRRMGRRMGGARSRTTVRVLTIGSLSLFEYRLFEFLLLFYSRESVIVVLLTDEAFVSDVGVL